MLNATLAKHVAEDSAGSGKSGNSMLLVVQRFPSFLFDMIDHLRSKCDSAKASKKRLQRGLNGQFGQSHARSLLFFAAMLQVSEITSVQKIIGVKSDDSPKLLSIFFNTSVKPFGIGKLQMRTIRACFTDPCIAWASRTHFMALAKPLPKSSSLQHLASRNYLHAAPSCHQAIIKSPNQSKVLKPLPPSHSVPWQDMLPTKQRRAGW